MDGARGKGGREAAEPIAGERRRAKSSRFAKARQAEEPTPVDPSIYAFDEVYDEIHSDRGRRQPGVSSGEAPERKSRYIGALLDQAKKRKLRNDAAYERKLRRDHR